MVVDTMSTFNPDDWQKEPMSPGEIVGGIGFALFIHATAFLLCFLWWLSLNTQQAAGEDVPLWIVVVCTTFTGVSAIQCVRVGNVFFTLFDEWRKMRRS